MVGRVPQRADDRHRTASDGRTHVLVVGNSLLDEDVRFDRLHDALAARWDARRFVVEQTFYYDWYYGLKRLYREGARPDVVVLMLSHETVASHRDRGATTRPTT